MRVTSIALTIGGNIGGDLPHEVPTREIVGRDTYSHTTYFRYPAALPCGQDTPTACADGTIQWGDENLTREDAIAIASALLLVAFETRP